MSNTHEMTSLILFLSHHSCLLPIENEKQKLSSVGCVSYLIFLSSPAHDNAIRALKRFVVVVGNTVFIYTQPFFIPLQSIKFSTD